VVYWSDEDLYSLLCLVHCNACSKEITLRDAGTLPNVLVVIVHCVSYISNVQPLAYALYHCCINCNSHICDLSSKNSARNSSISEHISVYFKFD